MDRLPPYSNSAAAFRFIARLTGGSVHKGWLYLSSDHLVGEGVK